MGQNGTAASPTSTVNLNFGAQVVNPETGMILNDEVPRTDLVYGHFVYLFLSFSHLDTPDYSQSTAPNHAQTTTLFHCSDHRQKI
ncbi:gamma-glutamyltranspeptidase 1 [Moniliophthora roreri]|nr:gamma-glutamyltranspeptidase 1 [Moniliophthora roreri]